MIGAIIEKLFLDYGIGELKVSKSNRPDLCDYQCNDIFRLSKQKGVSPLIILNTFLTMFSLLLQDS